MPKVGGRDARGEHEPLFVDPELPAFVLNRTTMNVYAESSDTRLYIPPSGKTTRWSLVPRFDPNLHQEAE